MLISYVDNVDNFLLFVENSFENRLKLHISLSIERIKFKMPGSQGHSTTSVQAHVVSDLLTLTSYKFQFPVYSKYCQSTVIL